MSSPWWTAWTAIFDEEEVQQGWMCTALCPLEDEHDYGKPVFCPVSLDSEIDQRITDPDVMKKFLDVVRRGAELTLEQYGCHHHLPDLVAP